MRQIFKFCQVGEFKIQRVDDEPAINRNRDENYPQHCHGDVVEENQVVDNGEEQKREESESSEYSKAPQPWNNLRLVFLRKKVQSLVERLGNTLRQRKQQTRKENEMKFKQTTER